MYVWVKIKWRIIMKPEEITNTIIQAIGQSYFKNHGERPSFFHSFFYHQHDIAKSLANYRENSTAFTKWNYLANIYCRLENHSGEIAETIRQLFASSFNRSIQIQLGSYHFSTKSLARDLKEIARLHFMNGEINALHTELDAAKADIAALKKQLHQLSIKNELHLGIFPSPIPLPSPQNEIKQTSPKFNN